MAWVLCESIEAEVHNKAKESWHRYPRESYTKACWSGSCYTELKIITTERAFRYTEELLYIIDGYSSTNQSRQARLDIITMCISHSTWPLCEIILLTIKFCEYYFMTLNIHLSFLTQSIHRFFYLSTASWELYVRADNRCHHWYHIVRLIRSLI